MSIFECEDYKRCVNDWILEQPNSGHGQLRRIAMHLGINSVVMSQVFRGDRHLTLEQALAVTKFIGLTDIESDYFLLLVQRARTSHYELVEIFSRQLEDLRSRAGALKSRVKHQKFTDEDCATFYSHWYYSAIRLGVSIPQLSSISAIAKHLNLDRPMVAKAIEFLLSNKLLVEKNGRLDLGPQVTHIGHDSPFVGRHHANWRLKGLQAMDQKSASQLFYSGPMALSEDATKTIRKNLIELVEKCTRTAAASDSEVLRCLNIDWFEV